MSDLAIGCHRATLKGDIPREVSPGLWGTYLTSEGSRKTERAALARYSSRGLTAMHKRLMKLEQIAMNPQMHPRTRVKNRPGRAIWQPQARALWIGSQPGINLNAATILKKLDECTAIIDAQLQAGMDARFIR